MEQMLPMMMEPPPASQSTAITTMMMKGSTQTVTTASSNTCISSATTPTLTQRCGDGGSYHKKSGHQHSPSYPTLCSVPSRKTSRRGTASSGGTQQQQHRQYMESSSSFDHNLHLAHSWIMGLMPSSSHQSSASYYQHPASQHHQQQVRRRQQQQLPLGSSSQHQQQQLRVSKRIVRSSSTSTTTPSCTTAVNLLLDGSPVSSRSCTSVAGPTLSSLEIATTPSTTAPPQQQQQPIEQPEPAPLVPLLDHPQDQQQFSSPLQSSLGPTSDTQYTSSWELDEDEPIQLLRFLPDPSPSLHSCNYPSQQQQLQYPTRSASLVWRPISPLEELGNAGVLLDPAPASPEQYQCQLQEQQQQNEHSNSFQLTSIHSAAVIASPSVFSHVSGSSPSSSLAAVAVSPAASRNCKGPVDCTASTVSLISYTTKEQQAHVVQGEGSHPRCYCSSGVSSCPSPRTPQEEQSHQEGFQLQLLQQIDLGTQRRQPSPLIRKSRSADDAMKTTTTSRLSRGRTATTSSSAERSNRSRGGAAFALVKTSHRSTRASRPVPPAPGLSSWRMPDVAHRVPALVVIRSGKSWLQARRWKSDQTELISTSASLGGHANICDDDLSQVTMDDDLFSSTLIANDVEDAEVAARERQRAAASSSKRPAGPARNYSDPYPMVEMMRASVHVSSHQERLRTNSDSVLTCAEIPQKQQQEVCINLEQLRLEKRKLARDEDNSTAWHSIGRGSPGERMLPPSSTNTNVRNNDSRAAYRYLHGHHYDPTWGITTTTLEGDDDDDFDQDGGPSKSGRMVLSSWPSDESDEEDFHAFARKNTSNASHRDASVHATVYTQRGMANRLPIQEKQGSQPLLSRSWHAPSTQGIKLSGGNRRDVLNEWPTSFPSTQPGDHFAFEQYPSISRMRHVGNQSLDLLESAGQGRNLHSK